MKNRDRHFTLFKNMKMLIKRPIMFLLVIHLVWSFFFLTACLALEANELLVVANRNARGSIGVAKDYMEKRDVPKENLLRIFVTDAETCIREDYEKKNCTTDSQ